ncbi:hypothetical protein GCM10022261_09340 [Brevibacterium daeguense]|uniref:Uncharacterized protein n=1 Tax=Brevibacterium daeguense TaxID=909936 RepID=A0ABP8EHL1_9MICO
MGLPLLPQTERVRLQPVLLVQPVPVRPVLVPVVRPVPDPLVRPVPQQPVPQQGPTRT